MTEYYIIWLCNYTSYQQPVNIPVIPQRGVKASCSPLSVSALSHLCVILSRWTELTCSRCVILLKGERGYWNMLSHSKGGLCIIAIIIRSLFVQWRVSQCVRTKWKSWISPESMKEGVTRELFHVTSYLSDTKQVNWNVFITLMLQLLKVELILMTLYTTGQLIIIYYHLYFVLKI